VTGTVTTGSDGSPLPGVNILIDGTNIGTTTDMNGKFSLNTRSNNDVLVVSFIGYTTQTIPVGSQTVIDVVLQEDVGTLSEVIVTGYSTQERKSVTGAVSTIKGSALVTVPSGSIERQLQGRIPGVTVISSGEPGANNIVRIRGFGSFTSNEPFYVVDGVPSGGARDYNGLDVENITVLKDAGSASIYGSRASSGVVLITTKRGKAGKMKIDLNLNSGVTFPGKGFDFLPTQETADRTFAALVNAGKTTGHPQYGSNLYATLPDYILVGGSGGLNEGDFDLAAAQAQYNINFNKGAIYQITRANKAGTDWFDEITRVAPFQNHLLSFSGGSEASRYYLSLGYFDEQGIVKNTYWKRYTLRANTEFNVLKNVRIGENLQIAYVDNPRIGGGEGSPIGMAFRQNPLIPVYDINGGYAGTRAPGFNNPSNPVANVDRLKENNGFAVASFGNLYGEVDFLDGFTAKTSIGGALFNFYNNGFAFRTYENAENVGSYTVSEGAGFGYDWTWSNTLRYSKQIDAHDFQILVGSEAGVYGVSRNMNGTGLNPFSINPEYRTLSTTDSRQVNGGANQGRSLYSLFGKIDYAFDERFLASVTLRRDGSSVFGSESRFGTFPAFTLGWRITEEDFMSAYPWADDVKIRGGWGKMGNQAINPNNQYNLYATNNQYASYDIGGTNNSAIAGLRQDRFANPLGQWETNETVNVGLDGTFFGGTLDFVFDWYKRTTEDLLYGPEAAATGGIPAAGNAIINVGTMENKGVDFQIIKRGKITTDWRYEVDFTWSTYKNTIVKISDTEKEFSAGGSRIGNISMNREGHPIASFYGYQVMGLFQNEAEIAGAATQDGAGVGRFRFADLNGRDAEGRLTGAPDGKITADDRTMIGNPHPDFTSGINLKIGYKRFELETNFYWVAGADLFNFSKWYTDFYPSFSGQAMSTRVRDSWTPTNPGAEVPIIEDVSNFSTNGQISSYYVEKGSYFRNRNTRLSYEIPSSALSRYNLEKLKVYVQVTNMFTISDYSGLDPSVGGGDTAFGVDTGNYPITRQLSFGINLGL
jgi:TonB-dependent starch-binding outer membrane protein SusC